MCKAHTIFTSNSFGRTAQRIKLISQLEQIQDRADGTMMRREKVPCAEVSVKKCEKEFRIVTRGDRDFGY